MTNKCKNKETHEERELSILREAVDIAQARAGKEIVNSPEIKKMISIVENFIRQKKLVCYGGTAINNLLPPHEQFYNKDIEIPDYDFFSDNALQHAKELADIYYKNGYTEVEAKSGQHHGTFKVFVDFIPVADITNLEKGLFSSVKKDSISVNGILYAPVNYLRMSMYLELSRPLGDISRWEKVLKRLILLNKHYPLKGKNCDALEFTRSFESNIEDQDDIYNIVKHTLVLNDVVFFGGYASNLYSRYMPKKERRSIPNYPDFDVLSEDPQAVATILKEQLTRKGYKKINIKKYDPIGENISEHYEVTVNNETVAMIYRPLACHSYNTINIQGQRVKIATIDTMLSFYLAFLYADKEYYDINRILCMADYLFRVQQKNRLQQKGLLRRFVANCYGVQETKEDMLAEKAKKFEELKDKKDTKEYEEWFLKYDPSLETKNKKYNTTNKIYSKKNKTVKANKSKQKSGTGKKHKKTSRLFKLFN